jgi:hypothetical protein
MNRPVDISFFDVLIVFLAGAVGGYVFARWGWGLAGGYAGAMTGMVVGVWRYRRIPQDAP